MFESDSENTSPLSMEDVASEVRRLVASAVASGVVSYVDIAAAVSRSKTLAQHYGDPASDANIPAFALVKLPRLGAYMLPALERLAARVLRSKLATDAPEVGANVVLARVADWLTALTTAMADSVITPDEARSLIRTATELRGALDKLVAQLQQRASTKSITGRA